MFGNAVPTRISKASQTCNRSRGGGAPSAREQEVALSSQQVKSVCAQIVSISMQEGKGLELQLEWFRLDIRKNFLIDQEQASEGC